MAAPGFGRSLVTDRSILDVGVGGDPTAFRATVRAWLTRSVPPGWHAQQAAASDEEQLAFQRWWFSQLVSVGMTSVHWPSAWGGEELGITQQIIFYEELARADAPNTAASVVSLNQVPATMFAAGTEQQKLRYVRGVLDGDIWCQGFSEPNAGSDLASLRTTALRDGDHYRVNGQKIWTSNAHFARYCLLLARTDPTAGRHQGMSLFVLDMNTPGLTIRRIRQANRQAEFNEVFLKDVVIPLENRIGPEGEGWIISQSALSSERGLMILEIAERLRQFLRRMIAKAKSGAAVWWHDDEHRRQFARAFADSEALALMLRRMLKENAKHPEVASQFAPLFIKLHFAQLLQRVGEFMVRVHELEGQELRPEIVTNGAPSGNWMYDYLSSWSWTIAGGTNEIIRNIIGERVLGLPR
jgi:alkylation response protein AidB-like acyl-CoA dehydrogenase